MFNFFNSNKGKVVNVNDLDGLGKGINLIDIRETYEYTGGSIKGAKNIPMMNLLSTPDKYLKKDKEYYIMCQSGGRSTRTCDALTKAGYDVVNVSGGMGAYVGTNRK